MDPRKRTVIDAHTHFHPAKAELLLAIMEANNISKIVNLGILEILDIPFEQGIRAFKETLGERMVYFGTPDFGDVSPGFGARMAEYLERKVEAGANGLKIFKELGLRHKDADGKLIPVDDPRLDPLWDTAGRLGVPVLIHTADPLAFWGPFDETNERWEELKGHPDWWFGGPEFPGHDELLEQRNRVIGRHPSTVFIGAHLGNYPEKLAHVDDCLERFPNFFVDTSARIGEIGRHAADQVRAFFIKHQDRILFGTDLVIGWTAFDDRSLKDLAEFEGFYDTHWRFFETQERQIKHPVHPIQGDWMVDAIDLPEEVLEKLYVSNAQRLIPGCRA
jgi:hypothetical protein